MKIYLLFVGILNCFDIGVLQALGKFINNIVKNMFEHDNIIE